MDDNSKFILVAILGLVISVPIWYTILPSEQFSLDLFFNPNLIFWLIFGFLALIFGFYSRSEE
jgi:hypothetical protein